MEENGLAHAPLGYAIPPIEELFQTRPGGSEETGALAHQLYVAADRLAEQSVDAIYGDPFWLARYGERGRAYCLGDERYHILYLVYALWFSSPPIMSGYTRWLQTVLTSRGMCTAHLVENFNLLDETLQGEFRDAALLAPYLAEAKSGLRYTHGPAGAVQDIAPQLLDDMIASTGITDARLQWYMRCLISYLADALALRRPELFAENLQWWAPFLERQGMHRSQLARGLEAMGAGTESLGPETREAIQSVMLSPFPL